METRNTKRTDLFLIDPRNIVVVAGFNVRIDFDLEELKEQIENRMRPFGIKNRTVSLGQGWYHHAVGAMLGTMKEDGAVVALIPGKFSGYVMVDVKTGKKLKLNRKTEKLIDEEATCFYKPLPQKSLKIGDLLMFMLL